MNKKQLASELLKLAKSLTSASLDDHKEEEIKLQQFEKALNNFIGFLKTNVASKEEVNLHLKNVLGSCLDLSKVIGITLKSISYHDGKKSK